MNPPSTIVLASGNPHKVAELRAMLGEAPSTADVDVLGLRDFDVAAPQVEETAATFAGNAELKARGIARWLADHDLVGRGAWVLADDSGVAVDALDGGPGVHSARFAGPGASDADNNRRLVTALTERGVTHCSGHYRCVLAVVGVGAPVAAGEDLVLFDGRWDVEVRTQARGSGGFGYDPHCWLDGGQRTVAELDAHDKAQRSHRGHALRAFLRWLSTP